MLFIPYHWKNGELESLCFKQPLRSSCFEEEIQKNDYSRYGGLILPFIGGLLIGGLFFPRPNYGAPQMPYASYPQPPMYITPQPYYSNGI